MWNNLCFQIPLLLLCHGAYPSGADLAREGLEDFATSTDSDIESTTVYVEPIAGARWTLRYIKNVNEWFYMSNLTATEEFFTFNIFSESNRRVSIQTSTSAYLTVDSSSKSLSFATSYSNRALFEVGHLENPYTFNLVYGNEPLVAYQSLPPLSFFLQSRFPTEAPAVFQVSHELDIEQAYAKQRGYIVKVATYIHDSSLMDKHVAYSKLVGLMDQYSHMEGKEIFIVASLIRMDLGENSSVFQALPRQVRLVAADADVKLFHRYEDGSIPIKYNSSSNYHQQIHPYQFHFDLLTLKFSITYARVHELQFSKTCTSLNFKPLVELLTNPVGSNPKNYEFDLYLKSNYSSFSLSTSNTLSYTCTKYDYAIITQVNGVQGTYFQIYSNTLGDIGSLFYVD